MLAVHFLTHLQAKSACRVKITPLVNFRRTYTQIRKKPIPAYTTPISKPSPVKAAHQAVKEWKLIYKDTNSNHRTQIYWGTGYMYGLIGLGVLTYFYLTRWADVRYAELIRAIDGNYFPLIIIVTLKSFMFSLFVIRRRLFVSEIYKNSSTSGQIKFYLTRINWLLRKEKFEFNEQDLKVTVLQPKQLNKLWNETYGNWKISFGPGRRSMRLFDHEFTSVDERCKFNKEE